MNEDYKWFEENYLELSKTYGDSFLVIKNKRVIGVYDSYGSGVSETRKTELLGTFIVQKCQANGEIFQCCIASMNFI